jgi:tRNA(fMet)-specific endonuclease VapC
LAQLIDTSVFVELERRILPLDTLLKIAPDETVALASISASELLVGVLRANSPTRRARRSAFVERLLESIPVLNFDLDAARIHSKISAQLWTEGNTIGAHDMIIAATALANDYSVLTANLREFSRVPGLLVRQPIW